jgi:ubiquinone/menaquinone biosynthesis C-methylase UbiE
MEQAQLQNKSVLDVGCGYGFYSLIAERLGASRIEGVDFSPEMIKLALEYKAKNESKVNYSIASMEKLPFPNNSFDVVISGMAMDVEDLNPAFSELDRVLTKNGNVIFSVPHPTNTHGKFDENGNFILNGYFKNGRYLSTWHTGDDKPITFSRPNKTIQDYTEALHSNNFVLIRLFESNPIFKEDDTAAVKLATRMTNIPAYLIIMAKKMNFPLLYPQLL